MKAREFRNAMSLMGNKKYLNVFSILYGNNITVMNDYRNIIEPLMKSERCNGDFLKACEIYEKTIEQEKDRIESAKKSQKVKDFRKKYLSWKSGYTMGERIVIVYKTPHRTVSETIADREQSYQGKGTKFNKTVKYGLAKLIVDLTGSRAKYTEEIIKK